MQVMSTAAQIPSGVECQRLSIMLPLGQDIRSMSFTKEQREAQAAKKLVRRQNLHPAAKPRHTRQHFTLKAVESSSHIPHQLTESRPELSNASAESLTTKKVADGHAVESPEDWRDSEIPSELECIHADAPDEIRNIVQESIDEHRALQASRQSGAQAIVVRTTITQSRTSDEDGAPTIGSESSASASIRRTNSSMSGELSSGLESTTSLSSSGSDPELLKPPTIYTQTAFTSSGDDMSEPHGIRATFRKRPLRDRGVFRLLASRKGKQRDLGYSDNENLRTNECTSCFDDIPSKKAVLLSCRHSYCSECFSQLISTAIKSESTFPPKCCLQEIPRKTILAHLSVQEMGNFDEKALEYAVAIANRYYCPSPDCAKWIDIRRAHGSDGSLECPQCRTAVCTMCRGAAHGKNQDCPHDFGLDATLKQAERAGILPAYAELNSETDQRRREDEIRRGLNRFEAEARAEEAEIRAAIAAVDAAERLVAEEREAEEERLAEEARQITAREYQRLEAITEFSERLRERLENVRLQQKQAIQRRHDDDLAKVEQKEGALISGERLLDKEQEMASDRVKLLMETQETIKYARKKHASQLVETVGRHRRDQDVYLMTSNEAMEADTSIDQTAVLEQLLQAQDLERSTLRKQQTREIQKLQKRAGVLLEDYDRKCEAARKERLSAQVEEAEDISRMATATKKRIDADWKWFEAIFLDRATMLGEDERRMILTGTDAPKSTYLSIWERCSNDEVTIG